MSLTPTGGSSQPTQDQTTHGVYGGTDISPGHGSAHPHHKNTAANFRQQDIGGLGGLGQLLESVPALANLLDQAVAQGWTAAKFQDKVEQSQWWKDHSASARQALMLQANDPAQWHQQLQNTEFNIQKLAGTLGMSLNEGQIMAIANHALLTGNDGNNAWLTQEISNGENYSHLRSTSGLQGGMAATVNQLRQMAMDYGMNWTPTQLAEHAQSILNGSTTIDTYQNNLMSWAESAFPGLAQQIKEGQTVKQLSDPYVSSMAQLLELNPDTLNVFTPMIRRAMQGVPDKQGQRVPMSLTDFEQQVRSDPRWGKTQNAVDTMSTALLKVGQDWGFGPNG